MSGAATAVYDGIPSRLDDMAPGPILGAFLSSLDVTKLSGYDQIIVLRAHQKMAIWLQRPPFKGDKRGVLRRVRGITRTHQPHT